jgi:hypothetical protein
MSLEVEQAVLAKMPNAELAKIRGVADYPQLRKIQLQVYQHLSSVASPFGTGDDGHLGLGMTAAKYLQRAGQPVFNHPADPGAYDLTIAHNAGSVVRARREAAHHEKLLAYKTCKAVAVVIKSQIKQAVPALLLTEIEDEITGLNGVAIIDIFDHLFQRRGQINDTLVAENQAKIDKRFSREEGMNNYIRRIEECQQLATDANEPWSDSQLVRKGQTAIGQCGFMVHDYTEWMRRAPADKTWADFRLYWNNRYTDFEEMCKLTAGAAGFSVNSATAGEAERDAKIDDAMDNLVAVMSSDKGQLETLSATNASLVAINVENASTIAELTRQNCQLLSLLKSMNLCQPGGGGGGGGGGGEPYEPRYRKPRGRDNDDSKFDGNGYCWTHGYRCHIGHSSATCKSENQGHKKAATRRNTMGGSSANKDWFKK